MPSEANDELTCSSRILFRNIEFDDAELYGAGQEGGNWVKHSGLSL